MRSPEPTRPARAVAAAMAADTTFVLTARGVVLEDAVLDLVDLAPSTICVEWSGPRAVSYLTTGQFLDLWAAAHADTVEASFGLLSPWPVADDPVRLQLRQPRIVGSGLRWTVTRMRGWLPSQSGSCVVVINPPDRGEGDNASGT